jgi:WD40 repeat protein
VRGQGTGHPQGENFLCLLRGIQPDGKTLASVSGDVKLWDLATNKERATLQGHTKEDKKTNKEDPDEATDDNADLAKSKAGGTCYFSDVIQPGERLLHQLRQFPAEFNFGGYTMVLAMSKDRTIRVTLG